MVHRMLLVRVGGKYIHLLKMFGALFTFACAFNVLSSAFLLSNTISCYQTPGSTLACDYANMGNVDVMSFSANDMFGLVAGPIASIFLWLSLMVLGLALYRSDRTILPIEEEIDNLADLPLPPFEEYWDDEDFWEPEEDEDELDLVPETPKKAKKAPSKKKKSSKKKATKKKSTKKKTSKKAKKKKG